MIPRDIRDQLRLGAYRTPQIDPDMLSGDTQGDFGDTQGVECTATDHHGMILLSVPGYARSILISYEDLSALCDDVAYPVLDWETIEALYAPGD